MRFGGGKKARLIRGEGSPSAGNTLVAKNASAEQAWHREQLALQEQQAFELKYTNQLFTFYFDGLKRNRRGFSGISFAATELCDDKEERLQLFVSSGTKSDVIQDFKNAAQKGAYKNLLGSHTSEDPDDQEMAEVMNTILRVIDKQVRGIVLSNHLIESVNKGTESQVAARQEELDSIIASLDIDFADYIPQSDKQHYADRIAIEYAQAFMAGSHAQIRTEVYEKLLELFDDTGEIDIDDPRVVGGKDFDYFVKRQAVRTTLLARRVMQGGATTHDEIENLVLISVKAKTFLKDGESLTSKFPVTRHIAENLYSVVESVDNPSVKRLLNYIGMAAMFKSPEVASREQLQAEPNKSVWQDIEDLADADLSLNDPDALDPRNPASIPDSKSPKVKVTEIDAEEAMRGLGMNDRYRRRVRVVGTAAAAGSILVTGIVASPHAAAATHANVQTAKPSTDEIVDGSTTIRLNQPSVGQEDNKQNTTSDSKPQAENKETIDKGVTVSPSETAPKQQADQGTRNSPSKPIPDVDKPGDSQESKSNQAANSLPHSADVPKTKTIRVTLPEIKEPTASAADTSEKEKPGASEVAGRPDGTEKPAETAPVKAAPQNANVVPSPEQRAAPETPVVSKPESPSTGEQPEQPQADIEKKDATDTKKPGTIRLTDRLPAEAKPDNQSSVAPEKEGDSPQSTSSGRADDSVREESATDKKEVSITPIEQPRTDGAALRIAITDQAPEVIPAAVQESVPEKAAPKKTRFGTIRASLPTFSRDTVNEVIERRRAIEITQQRKEKSFLDSLAFAASQSGSVSESVLKLQTEFQDILGQPKTIPADITKGMSMLARHYGSQNDGARESLALAQLTLSHPQLLQDTPAALQEKWKMPVQDEAQVTALEKNLEERLDALKKGIFGENPDFDEDHKNAVARMVFVAEAHTYSPEKIASIVAKYAPAAPMSVEAPISTAEIVAMPETEMLKQAVERAAAQFGWSANQVETARALAAHGAPAACMAACVSGVMGNMSVESGFDPNIIERTTREKKGAYLVQWTFERRDRIEAAAEAAGVDLSVESAESIWFQIEYLIKESQDRSQRGNQDLNEWAEFVKITDPVEATEYFRWHFERPNERLSHTDKRVKNARAIYDQISVHFEAVKAETAARLVTERAAAEAASRAAERGEVMTSGKSIFYEMYARYGGKSGMLNDSELASFTALYADGKSPIEVKLQPEAARQLEKLFQAYHHDTGVDLRITDHYRSFDAQVRLSDGGKNGLAAEPGTSNHGWGLAVDLDTDTPGFYEWMHAHAAEYGWVLPEWARLGGSKPEPWHWEYIGGDIGKGYQGLSIGEAAKVTGVPTYHHHW